MKRIPSILVPALVLALAMLAASALAAAAPHEAWAAAGGPLLLVVALLGADVLYRRRLGLSSRPSSSTLILAAIFLVACGILAMSGADRLAGMVPILGSSLALPVIWRPDGARTSCRRA